MVIIKSKVEDAILKRSGYDKDIYKPSEKIRTFIIDSFPLLGKVVAYRFIEWVINNPNGVCALPTGKTPEYFIKWTNKIINEWDTQYIKEDRKQYGLYDDNIIPPKFDNIWFVMLDEFYPMNPKHHNSFNYYVKQYYINGLGLNPDKCLYIDLSTLGLHNHETLDDIWPSGTFVDLSLRLRKANNPLELRQQEIIRKIDEWCLEYENKIRELGASVAAAGIGFFLGGIGPDGHIAFNIRGTDHRSCTRLTELNYETQAVAAGDLGGIDAVKAKCAVTIGLGTITYNINCICIIIAAGEAKAPMVSNAIQEDTNIMYPSHALRILPNAAFYITRGASKLLIQRNIIDLEAAAAATSEHNIKNDDNNNSGVIIDIEHIEKILVDIAVDSHKRLLDLNKVDIMSNPLGKVLINRLGWKEDNIHETCVIIRDRLISKINKGTEILNDTIFLHTEPHHDDIMLGYLPTVIRQTRPTSNKHYFICATSGFNSVSNNHLRNIVKRCRHFISSNIFKKLVNEGYFLSKCKPSKQQSRYNNVIELEHYEVVRSRDVWQYLDGVADKNINDKNEGSARRFIRNIIEIYGISHNNNNDDDGTDLCNKIKNKLDEIDEYINNVYPGQADTKDIQILKGSCREFESECAWGSLGWLPSHIKHLRLGFYTSDIFTPEPTLERDSKPVLDLLLETKPDIVTVAFDPEASGPDTHYKVLQAVTEALKEYQSIRKDKIIKVWGYRNVWYRFNTNEVTHIVPSSLSSLGSLDRMFMDNFESQTAAEFPSFEYDGPFSQLASHIQVDQYKKLKVCLGRSWFQEHDSALIRATKGLVYFKEMTINELETHSRTLRNKAETYY